MSIVLMTRNSKKIPEYRSFLGRYAQTVVVEEPTDNPEIITAWLRAHRAVFDDESNIFDLQGNSVKKDYVGPARNICRVHAHVLQDGGLVRRTYIRSIEGTFDATQLRPGDPAVFSWDSAFALQDVVLHELAVAGLKNSARDNCLSAFAQEFLQYPEPKRLQWTAMDPQSIVDWDTDASLLVQHPLYQNLPPDLGSVLAYVVNQGVFFRSAQSRREGNYWDPGLNGGIPYVPKGHRAHEGKYLFHDGVHHVMPDLIRDGQDSRLHRRVDIIYRMMSEAVSLVFADMVYAAHLARSGLEPDYDFAAQRIYPLYLLMQHLPLQVLLYRMVRYVVLADTSGFPTASPEWKNFEEKYSRFFIGDFQWTRVNWANMLGRADTFRRWINLVTPNGLRDQNLWLVSDVVNQLPPRELDLSTLVDMLFEQVWQRRIAPALAYTPPPHIALSRSNGFRRWLTGQLFLFSRYERFVGLPQLAGELADRIRDNTPFSDDEVEYIRRRFRDHVLDLARQGLISQDDARIFPDLVPLFDPFFLKDYDRSAQEFATLAQASAAALG